MNFSQFFISRPIFAGVISLIIMIAGSIAVFQLPITEYPEVVPLQLLLLPSTQAPTPPLLATQLQHR